MASTLPSLLHPRRRRTLPRHVPPSLTPVAWGVIIDCKHNPVLVPILLFGGADFHRHQPGFQLSFASRCAYTCARLGSMEVTPATWPALDSFSDNTDSSLRYVSGQEASVASTSRASFICGGITTCSKSLTRQAMVLGLYLRASLDHAHTLQQSSMPPKMATASPLHPWRTIAKSFAKTLRSSAPSPPSPRRIYSSVYLKAVYASRLEALILCLKRKEQSPHSAGFPSNSGRFVRHRSKASFAPPLLPPPRPSTTAARNC